MSKPGSESRLERSERYWHMAAEAFHASFMASRPEVKASFVRIAMAWATMANELERAEESWSADGPAFPRDPIRPRHQHLPK